MGLSCSRRAYEKDSLGDPCSELDVFLRIFEEVDYFSKFLLFLLKPCDLFKGYLLVLYHAGFGFAEGHNSLATLSVHVPHHYDHEDDEYDRRNEREYGQPVAWLYGLYLELPFRRLRNYVLLGDDRHIIIRRRISYEFRSVFKSTCITPGSGRYLDGRDLFA